MKKIFTLKIILFYFLVGINCLKAQVVAVAGYTISTIPVTHTVQQLAVDYAGKRILLTGPVSNGVLDIFNISTGVTSTVSSTWASNAINCWYPYASTDIEYYNGYMYSCIPSNVSNRDSIVKTNLATGISSVVVTPAMPAGLTGIEGGAAFVRNKFYFTVPNTTGSIFCFDLNTMTISNFSVGLPLVSYHTLEYNPVDDRLYVSAGNALYKVNLATPTITSIGNLNSAAFSQFALDPNGLYAWTQDGSSVYKMSLATGASTAIVNSLGGGNFQDLKFGPSTGSCTTNGTSLYIGNNNNLLELKGFANTIAALSVNTLTYCLGSTFKLPYIAIGNYCSGNIFTAQLSNATGSFTTPVTIGTQTTSSGADTLICTIPTTVSAGTGYKIRIISTSPAITGYSSAMTLTVLASSVPVVSVTGANICAGNSFTISPSGATTYSYSSVSPIVSPSVSTSYSVVGTNSAGCISAPAVSSVTVFPAPVINVSSGSICIGNSFTIHPSGAAGYTISGGSAIVSPTTTTSYSVTGTSASGCNSIFASTTTVTVLSLPVITTGTTHSVLCPQQTAILSASGAVTYTWLPSGSGPNILVSPTATTTYSVSGTDNYGCKNNATLTQIVSACTGVQENINVAAGISIFPNPFSNKVYVRFDKDVVSPGTKIIIHNMLGSVIYSSAVENKNTDINLENETSGIYFMEIITSQNRSVFKLLKQ